ncbi:diguanylate cyclase [uncultured Desulfosarcina sp.]|uniref:GGDEF domain-containing protein n=1 Tax=uncultured Desulfosarcina sp. TaxID=218289 RepID=UPI0029C664C7|nr:diguanylate cyclase [uncultured Desulfosarcina sp.]
MTTTDPIYGQKEALVARGKPLLLTAIVALICGIGWVRFLTGPEFAFSLLYLPPIITVTWFFGLFWGIFSALLSTLSILMADLSLIDRFSSPYIPLANESFRLIIFLFMVFIIFRYKKILARHKEMAMMDPLTRIANRRAFFHLAGMEIDRSRRYGHPFSVMVIDVDDFKQINDRFGHDAGDRLLITMVDTIRRHIRGIDIVARFGGDEFVVLLVKTGEEAAAMVAGKLKSRLLSVVAENRWPVTFSIGMATYHSVPENVEETIRAADRLMYQVKHDGKNDIRHAVLKN